MKHKPIKKSDFYKASGDKVERKGKTCDRCGDGVFMAHHKNRWTCGKCGMTIFKKKESTEKASEKKTEKKG